MMSRARLISIAAITFLSIAVPCLGQGSVESKIKNGKLLAGKAVAAQGDERTDLVYKAKREFERASTGEPENPLPYYWQAVLAFYLEGDSATAGKLYNKALTAGAGKLEKMPAPWAYKSDRNLLAAFDGDYKWAEGSGKPEPEKEPIKEERVERPEEPKVDPLRLLTQAIEAGDLKKAESLYSELDARPDYRQKSEFILAGLELKFAKDSPSEASTLLLNIEEDQGRRSQPFKKAMTFYDANLDSAIATARALERKGEFSSAEGELEKWEPWRERPSTPARGRLALLYCSIQLSQGRLASADSLLGLYDRLGYERNDAYRNLKDRLSLASRKPEPPPKETPAIVAERIERKAAPENYVTISPPGDEIVKVIISSIDPTTGAVKSSELWETAAPTKLKTGAAYKLTVLKKQERTVPRYIALAGILATFLIVR